MKIAAFFLLIFLKTTSCYSDDTLLLKEIDYLNTSYLSNHSSNFIFDAILSTTCYETDEKEDITLSDAYSFHNEDYGVSFESGAKYTQGDSKQNNRFMYAGLAWDVFSQGYYDNDYKAKSLLYKDELALREGKNFSGLKLQSIQAYITSSFNNKKLSIYERKNYFNQRYKEIIRKKYFFNLATKMDVENSILITERDLFLEKEYRDFKKRTKCEGASEETFWPYFQIDTSILKKRIEANTYGEDSNMLADKMIEEKYDWKRDVRLKLYARGENTDSGSGASVGFNLKIPLTTDLDKMENYEKYEFKSKKREEIETLSILLDREYYDFNQKISQAIRLNHTYKKVLRKLELHRARFGIYDKLDLFEFLKDIEEAYSLKLQILENKQQIYHKGFEILYLAKQDSVESLSLLEFQEEKVSGSRIRVGRRSVYLWASDFNQMDNDTLVNVLQAKEIEEVLLTISSKVDEQKALSFIGLANRHKIGVRLLFSNNNAIYKKNYSSLIKGIDRAKRFGLTLQLDVEPHTLQQLKHDRAKYYKMYTEMLEFAYNEANEGIGIDIAIPLHYDKDYVETKYAPLVDKVYLMAYEHADANYVIEKIKKFESIKSKLVIAVSPTDFKNEWEMELFIEKIAKETGLNEFAIHDMKRYKELLQ